LSADAADAVPARVSRALDLSNILAGWIVVVASYRAAFISLGIIAAVGLALYATAMPETGPKAARKGG
jgi:hypothetical protein